MNELTHLAIILDGNRSWAVEKGLPKMMGHTEGAKNIKQIVKEVIKQNIPYLTLYTLSTENLKNRSQQELDHLFSLFGKLVDYLGDFFKNNVKLTIIGNLSELPDSVQKSLQTTCENTKNHTGLVLTLAVNYGGRDEIVRAVRKIVTSQIKAESITENVVKDNLDSGVLPPVDLMIRTSKHQRISNYLIWQAAYAELYFTEVHWPDFSPQNLQAAVTWYYSQVRKSGK